MIYCLVETEYNSSCLFSTDSLHSFGSLVFVWKVLKESLDGKEEIYGVQEKYRKRVVFQTIKKIKSDESPLPIMAPMPLQVYDPSGGAPPQRVAPLQSTISTEPSSSDSESTPDQAAVKEDVATTKKGKEPLTSKNFPS